MKPYTIIRTAPKFAARAVETLHATSLQINRVIADLIRNPRIVLNHDFIRICKMTMIRNLANLVNLAKIAVQTIDGHVNSLFKL